MFHVNSIEVKVCKNVYDYESEEKGIVYFSCSNCGLGNFLLSSDFIMNEVVEDSRFPGKCGVTCKHCNRFNPLHNVDWDDNDFAYDEFVRELD